MSISFRSAPSFDNSWSIVALMVLAGGLGSALVSSSKAEPVALPEAPRVSPPPRALPPVASPAPALEPATEPEGEAVPLADPPTPRADDLTALEEAAAARALAEAWRGRLGDAPSPRTLAILWAHWAHETGRGRRMFGHNFGGLKGAGPDGRSVFAWTREAPDFDRLVLRKFRAYPSFADGASDYVELLRSRYPRALRAAKSGDVVQFADALALAGYFTDDPPAYRRALASLALECLERTLPEAALLALGET